MELMRELKLDVDDVARLTVYSRHAVVSWLKPESTRSHRSMPDRAMQVLELKLSVWKHTGKEPYA